MRHFLCTIVVALLALIILPETVSAKSTPWTWHHATPIYSVRENASSGHTRFYRGRRNVTARRQVVSPRRISTIEWHHATPILSTKRSR